MITNEPRVLIPMHPSKGASANATPISMMLMIQMPWPAILVTVLELNVMPRGVQRVNIAITYLMVSFVGVKTAGIPMQI